MKKDFNAIVASAIAAADPRTAVHRHLALDDRGLILKTIPGEAIVFDLERFSRVMVVGAGKAAAPMARAVEDLLSGRVEGGFVVVKDGHLGAPGRIRQVEASHPVPDSRGIEAARAMHGLVNGLGEDDLLISLISGGASALLPLPAPGISIEDKIRVTELLLKSGAAIEEMNAVRKHLSLSKGGMLAAAAYPATVINLLVSDVVGDDLGVIGSGPFTPDSSTFADALGVLNKYGLIEKATVPVIERLQGGARGELEETPKQGDRVFERVHSVIIASNLLSLTAAKETATSLGYHAVILSSSIEGEASEAARWHADIAREVVRSGNPVPPPACIISGGETTVTVRGGGKGGRNMEFALHAALHLADSGGILMGSVGTDGTDGPTDAAGAVADGNTLPRAQASGMDIKDYMARNDSYNFFKELGDLVITGPTRTNVMDVRIILAKP